MITFQEAVGQTKALYEEAKRLYGDDLNEALRESRTQFWTKTNKYGLDWTIERLDGDAFTFETVKLAIAIRLEKKLPLSKFTQDWLIKFLRGEVEKPPEIAGRKDTFGRDSFIIYAISQLKSQGIPVNPRSPPINTSACEALAEVIKEENLSLRRITNIWNDRPSYYLFGKIHWESELYLFRQTLVKQKLSQK